MSFLLPKISPPPLLPHPSRYCQSALPRSQPYPLTRLDLPPIRDSKPAPSQDRRGPAQDKKGSAQDKDEFYLNVGMAVRTLREDIPALFDKDLNYDIYRR